MSITIQIKVQEVHPFWELNAHINVCCNVLPNGDCDGKVREFRIELYETYKNVPGKV